MMRRRRLSGFTLLEIMLVMLLLSLTAAVIVPTFPNPTNDDAKQEAQRFYQLIQLWNEQSLVMSKVMGVRVEEDKYTLLELSDKNWKEVQKRNRVVTAVDMPEEIKLEIEVAGMVDNEDQLFSRESLFDDLDFNEADEEEKIDPPQLVMMGNGELFAFDLIFSADGENLWKVTGTDIGEFTLASFNEDEE